MPEPKFLYGSHYSTPGYVLYYLVRVGKFFAKDCFFFWKSNAYPPWVPEVSRSRRAGAEIAGGGGWRRATSPLVISAPALRQRETSGTQVYCISCRARMPVFETFMPVFFFTPLITKASPVFCPQHPSSCCVYREGNSTNQTDYLTGQRLIGFCLSVVLKEFIAKMTNIAVTANFSLLRRRLSVWSTILTFTANCHNTDILNY